MKLRRDGRETASASFVQHIDTCLGCMACVTACPSGVQYDSLLEAARPQVERDAKRGVRRSRVPPIDFRDVSSSRAAARVVVAARSLSEARHSAARSLVRASRAAAQAPAGDGASVAADHIRRRRSAGAHSGAGRAAQARRTAARMRPARVLRQRQRGDGARACRRRLRGGRSADASVLRCARRTRRRRGRCHGGGQEADRCVRGEPTPTPSSSTRRAAAPR